MAKKVKITKGGQTVYPATVMDAVVHPDLRVDASKLIEEVNVSKIYPTGGIDGTNKYTLETAIAMIPASLRSVGIKCSFLDEAGKMETWEFTGGTFTNTSSWEKVGFAAFSYLKRELSIIQLSNQYINKIDPIYGYTKGYILNSQGAEQVFEAGGIVNFINVNGFSKIFSNIYAYGNMYGYDEDFNFVRVIPSNSGGYSGAYLIDNGIKYIRFSISNFANNAGRIWLYTDENYVGSNHSNINVSTTYHDYGITYTDITQEAGINNLEERADRLEISLNDKVSSEDFGSTNATINNKVDKFSSDYLNTINMWSTDMVEEEGKLLQANGNVINFAANFISKFVPIKGGDLISTNIWAYGTFLYYNESKEVISTFSENGYEYNNSMQSNSIAFAVAPENARFIRFSVKIAQYSLLMFAIGNKVYSLYPYGISYNMHMKYGGKKLVCIGDSITYGCYVWVSKLCEMTGMIYNPKEIRGDVENSGLEGHGYILLTELLEDTDTYYEEVEGINKTEETVTDGFGYAHPIWQDSEGNKYRQPYRSAQGGTTLLPVANNSIYSRSVDVKYYKPDVIIVFAGANDKFTYLTNYPNSITKISDIQGITNLAKFEEDDTRQDYEIYENNALLSVDGDYSGEGADKDKYNHTFRACYRGMLKKLVDTNPNAEIIVIGPYMTMPKDMYMERVYDYLTIEENKVIEQCAREFSCQYIDLRPIFAGYKGNRYFGTNDIGVYIHPNSAGGLKIARYIAANIL